MISNITNTVFECAVLGKHQRLHYEGEQHMVHGQSSQPPQPPAYSPYPNMNPLGAATLRGRPARSLKGALCEGDFAMLDRIQSSELLHQLGFMPIVDSGCPKRTGCQDLSRKIPRCVGWSGLHDTDRAISIANFILARRDNTPAAQPQPGNEESPRQKVHPQHLKHVSICFPSDTLLAHLECKASDNWDPWPYQCGWWKSSSAASLANACTSTTAPQEPLLASLETELF